MTNYAVLAQRLEQALDLTTTLVAITFLAQAPDGVAPPLEPVAAGCAFWELGAERAIATNAEHHQFCSIGIHTHNLAGAPQNQPDQLQATLATMQGLDYVRPEEVEAVPVMAQSNACVVYAPLKQVGDRAPSVVLVFAHAAQGLVLSEALSRVDGVMPAAMGRPACALVPYVLNGTKAAASLGCCGARAYLDVLDDNITVWGLPGLKIDAYVAEIETLAKANEVLRNFHELRRADIESGGAPTVEQSLARLTSG